MKSSASGDHPGYWVLGFLSLPDLATRMLRRAAPPPRGPTITFEAPEGWKVKVVPFRLDLKKGKLIGEITAFSDEFLFKAMQRQKEYWPPKLPPTRQTLDVSFGPCAGKKYHGTHTFKSVDYLLAVPGGFVSCMLTALSGDFDESLFEAQLHTLQLSWEDAAPNKTIVEGPTNEPA